MTSETDNPLEMLDRYEAGPIQPPAPVSANAPARHPSELLAMALERNASIDTVERLVALMERMQQAEALRQLWHALAAAQGEFPEIPKRRRVDGARQKYRYASLDDMIGVVAPILARHGLSVTFHREFHKAGSGELLTVSSSLMLHHSSGASHTFPPVTVPVESRKSREGNLLMSPSQSVGAAMTYADRYAYQGGLGVRPCDQDTDAPTPPRDSRGRNSQPPKNPDPLDPLDVKTFTAALDRNFGVTADQALEFARANMLNCEALDTLDTLTREQGAQIYRYFDRQAQRAAAETAAPAESQAGADPEPDETIENEITEEPES